MKVYRYITGKDDAAFCHRITDALNRGWEGRDSRSPMLLQLERAGLKVEADPKRIQAVLERDPPFGGLDPKRG